MTKGRINDVDKDQERKISKGRARESSRDGKQRGSV